MDQLSGDRSDEREARRWIVGPWRVDGDADEIESDGRLVKLEPQQMRLLLVLARRAGQVVTTQELLDDVWRDLVVTPNSVYQAVAQLRRQLGDTAAEPSFIQTVHRKGYRLLAPARRDDGAPAAQRPQGTAAQAAAVAASPFPASASVPRREVAARPSAAAMHLPVPCAPPRPGAPDPSPDRSAAPSGGTDLDAVAASPASAAAGDRVMPHSAASAWPLSRRGLVQATGATALAAAAAALAWWRLGRPAVPAPTGRARIAVLPFADHGAGPALAQGLALDVIRMLGQRADLDVMAPDTVLGLSAGNEAERAALVQRLQVQYLLVGELAPARPLLHLDVRLFGSRSDAAMWQRRFESAAPELSQLPARVARELSAVLGLPALAQAPGPGASDAYELYVLGVNAWQAKTPEAFEKARQYFQRGIDLDPNFARNHVGLGWSWLGQATSGPGLDVPQAIARATPLFERALALDPEAADALTGQAMLYRFAGEFDTARRLLERAIAVQPSYRQALFTLGIVEFDDGWPDKAAAQFERVVALDPLGASGPERLGLARMLGGQTDVAARHFRRALTLEPRYPNGVWGLGMLGYALGNLVQAVDNYRQALALEPRRPYLWHELAWLYLDLQRPDEAATAFQRALEHLPGVGWLAVHAALAWVSRGADASRGAAPSALEPTPRRADDGADFASLCFVRAMAGLPVDAALLQRSLDVAAARGQQWTPGAWFVFMGWYGQLQLATLQAMLGQSATAANTLTSVEQRLDTLERQGNRWHALHFHRARVLALRGRPTDAMAALERAVAGGSRRAWWLRLDPALAALRSQPRFGRLLSEVDTLVAGQRQQLGL